MGRHVKVSVRGMGNLQATVKRAQTHIFTGVIAALEELEEPIQEHARGLVINGPKTGRFYTRNRKLHQASAPGEAPANDTGRLAASIYATVNAWQFNISLSAGRAAKFLETGTSKMAPRPFLYRTILHFRERIVQTITKKVREKVRQK